MCWRSPPSAVDSHISAWTTGSSKSNSERNKDARAENIKLAVTVWPTRWSGDKSFQINAETAHSSCEYPTVIRQEVVIGHDRFWHLVRRLEDTIWRNLTRIMHRPHAAIAAMDECFDARESQVESR